ncbi:MAG: hypothetical protein M0C28_16150 [Candidatus Moduliflexus flocculans]|nr:hypothetical protein [Candidatus Moduliflexus flocculans]
MSERSFRYYAKKYGLGHDEEEEPYDEPGPPARRGVSRRQGGCCSRGAPPCRRPAPADGERPRSAVAERPPSARPARRPPLGRRSSPSRSRGRRGAGRPGADVPRVPRPRRPEWSSSSTRPSRAPSG